MGLKEHSLAPMHHSFQEMFNSKTNHHVVCIHVSTSNAEAISWNSKLYPCITFILVNVISTSSFNFKLICSLYSDTFGKVAWTINLYKNLIRPFGINGQESHDSHVTHKRSRYAEQAGLQCKYMQAHTITSQHVCLNLL